MIPFKNTWPYEMMYDDYYFSQCPFCGAENVLLPFKKKDLQEIKTGTKRLLVLPCCFSSIKVVDMDEDYLLADRKVR